MFSIAAGIQRNKRLNDDPRNTAGFFALNKVKICYCEDTTTTTSTSIDAASLQERSESEEIIRTKRADETHEYCPSCLVVGVGTCIGLAGYFAYAAFGPPTPYETAASHVRRKPIFLAISAGWVGIGIYRLYLG